MYSREERMKAIEPYIKYDKSAADVVRELGYPSYKMVRKWYKAYLKEQETGVLWQGYSGRPRYSLEQRRLLWSTILSTVAVWQGQGEHWAIL